MKPDFTLSLSFDGIRLLERVDEGWHLIGEVALDNSDLDAAMADLRKTAESRAGGKILTKLLIPNEQIKYTAIDSTQTDRADVESVLEGATPYAVSELAIDFDRSGGRTHIAACALETLQEAEGFATQHGFSPLCFTAVAPPFTFSSEVFFGPTEVASTLVDDPDAIERDDDPVKVLGTIPNAAAPTKPATTHSDNDAKNDEVEAEEPDQSPQVVFASRSRPETTGRNEAAIPEPTVDAPQKPPTTSAATEEAGAEPLFVRRREPVLAVPGSVPAPVQDQGDFAANAASSTKAPVVAPKREPSQPGTKRRRRSQQKDDDMSVFGARNANKVNGKPRYLGLMLTAALVIAMFLVALWANTLTEEGIAGWFNRDPGIIEAPEPQIAVLPAAQDPVTAPEAEIDQTQSALAQETAAPLPSAEGETGTLPILRENTGRVLSPAEADRVYAATGVYQRAPRLPLIPRTETLEGLQAAKSLPTAQRLAAITIPDDEPMLPDFALSPQRNPPPPGTTYQRDLLGFILATPEGTLTPDGVLVFAGTPEFAPPLRPGTEIIAPTRVSNRSANAIPGLRLVAGPPPIAPPLRPTSLEEAAAETIAPQTDPDETVVAENELSVADETVPSAEIVAAVSSSVSDALADLDQRPQSQGEEATVQLAALDASSDLDEAPTPNAEAAQPPDPSLALNVLSGRPELEPPLRPDSFEALSPGPAPALEEATETGVAVVNPTDLRTQDGSALREFRPSLRPDTVTAQNDLLARADPALAGARPNPRPEGLAPAEPDQQAIAAAVEEANTVDLNAVIATLEGAAEAQLPASRLAVASSLRPDARPNNFATVVARATRTSAPQQQTATVSSAPAISSGPVPGGVARAATMEDAIRLRDINLIGVYGRPGDRRALVRLSNGSYVKVEIGSTLDGGRVTAIGDSALNYVKRGQTYALQLPAG